MRFTKELFTLGQCKTFIQYFMLKPKGKQFFPLLNIQFLHFCHIYDLKIVKSNNYL